MGYYESGVRDAQNDDYDPPSIASFTFPVTEDEQNAYLKGYWHTKGQLDAVENEYREPGAAPCGSEQREEMREVYRESWRAAREDYERNH
jgi:hypothetical protein